MERKQGTLNSTACIQEILSSRIDHSQKIEFLVRMSDYAVPAFKQDMVEKIISKTRLPPGSPFEYSYLVRWKPVWVSKDKIPPSLLKSFIKTQNPKWTRDKQPQSKKSCVDPPYGDTKSRTDSSSVWIQLL